MNSDLDNHISKCRCCFRALQSQNESTNITDFIRKQFFEVVQVELNPSEVYSSIICNICKVQLDDAAETRKKFGENQKKLYKFVSDRQHIKTEQNVDTKEFSEDFDQSSTPDQFAFRNVTPEEVVVKVETQDICVNEYEDYSFIKNEQYLPASNQNANKNSSKTTKRKSKIKKESVNDDSYSMSQPKAKRNVNDLYKLCQLCGKSLKMRSYYPHMDKHRKEMNKTFFQCDHCNYSTAVKRLLYDHMNVHKSNESKIAFPCHLCDIVCYRKQVLRQHVRNAHEIQEPATCEICNRTFKSRSSLFSHRADVHRGTVFPCDKCEKVFNSKSVRRKHNDFHHAPKSPCEICGQMVGAGPATRLHIKMVHGQVFCTFEGCGKVFANKNILKAHIAYKHSPEVDLKCPDCNSEFKNEYRLKVHIDRQHNSEKRPCPVASCNHSTTRRAYMIMHLNNHKDITTEEKERLIEELKSKKF